MINTLKVIKVKKRRNKTSMIRVQPSDIPVDLVLWSFVCEVVCIAGKKVAVL